MNKVVWHAKFDTDREAAAGMNAAIAAGVLAHEAQIYPSLSFDAGGDDKSYVVLIADASLDPNTLNLPFTFERITEMDVADETQQQEEHSDVVAAPEGEW